MNDIIDPPAERAVNENHELDRLLVRYRAATGPGITFMNKLGAQADGMMDYIPQSAQEGLHLATEKALQGAIRAADLSHKILPREDARLTRVVAAAMGAVGGVGGIGTALFDDICARFKGDGVQIVRTMLARDDQLNMAFFRSQGLMAGSFIELEKPID